MSNNPNHFNRKMVSPGSFKTGFPTVEFNKPSYQWRTWMKDKLFAMKGKKYKIVSGTWICKDGEVLDAIKFENVLPPNESDYPIQVLTMDEKSFFEKVDKSKLK